MFVVEIEFVDHGLDHRLGVIGIIDGKAAGVTDFIGFKTQDAGKDGVEGSDIKVAGFPVAEDMFYPFFHFLGRLIGKSEGENIESVYSTGHQVDNAGGQHLGFAASGPRYDHDWSFLMEYSFPLPLVQSLQII